MRVGTVNYATDQGLGILVKSFYDAGIVTDVFIVEHSEYLSNFDWYPDAPSAPVKSLLTRRGVGVHNFVRQMDVMLFFETPFDWSLLPFCKANHIPTALMPMYECMPKVLPHQPDKFICPSLLDLQYYPDNGVFIPVPVDVEWRQRTDANQFVHNAGHLGLKGRNGSLELLQAMRHVKSPLELLVRSQTAEMEAIVKNVPEIESDERITVKVGSVPYGELWSAGDVLVHPEKFNGLSLPLQEARAAGMMVMSTNRFPANEWLPNDPLIPVESFFRSSVSGSRLEFEQANVTPEDIAITMDEWFGSDISEYSLAGKEWAETMSWKALKPRYMEVLESL